MRDKFQVEVPLGRRYIGSGDQNRAAALDRQDLLIAQETWEKKNIERREAEEDREQGKHLEGDKTENSPSVNWAKSFLALESCLDWGTREWSLKEEKRPDQAGAQADHWAAELTQLPLIAGWVLVKRGDGRCRNYSDLTSRYCQDSK